MHHFFQHDPHKNTRVFDWRAAWKILPLPESIKCISRNLIPPFLNEMTPILNLKGSGQFLMLPLSSSMTAGPSTGSCMPMAMVLLPGHSFFSQSLALRETSAPGESMDSGTRWGNLRTPPLYRASGKGASYAAHSSSLTCGHERFMSFPMAMSGFFSTHALHAMNPSGSFTSPVPRVVFMMIIRENLSGISMGSVSPRMPPQS